MQIAICDDEEEIRDLLKRKITDLYPGAGLHVYGSGDELLKAGKHVDLLLLDIQMPGLNGMDTAVEFRKKNPQAVLIFVTALEGYVFQAFDVGAFHYLVKPFDGEKLKEVLRRAADEKDASRPGRAVFCDKDRRRPQKNLFERYCLCRDL